MPQRLADERHVIRGVNQAIHDCIRYRFAVHEVMPMFHGKLTGDDDRPGTAPAVNQFKDVVGGVRDFV